MARESDQVASRKLLFMTVTATTQCFLAIAEFLLVTFYFLNAAQLSFEILTGLSALFIKLYLVSSLGICNR